jgi:transposase InsO family protein
VSFAAEEQGTTGFVTKSVMRLEHGRRFERARTHKRPSTREILFNDLKARSAARSEPPFTSVSLRCARKSRKRVSHSFRASLFQKKFSQNNLSIFTLTDFQLKKIHLHGHAPVSRILKFLKCTIPIEKQGDKEVRRELASIGRRLGNIVASCSCSRAKKPHQHARTSINLRVVEEFNSVVELDILHVHSDEIFSSEWAAGNSTTRILTLSCRGSGWTLFQLVDSARSQDVAKAFILNWANAWGAPTRVSWTDMGSEFLGQHFIEACGGFGLLKLCGAPRTSKSHGFIEVRNRFLRQALRSCGTIDVANLPLILSTFSNEYNNSNIRLVNGELTTPSLRAFGRSTSSFRNCLNDTVSSAFHESEPLRIAEAARSAWRKEVSDTKLRKILRTPAPPQKFASFKNNQLIYYFTGGAERRWRGPAVIIGINGISKSAHIDHGGILLHAHIDCLRSCDDIDCVRENIENSIVPEHIDANIPNAEVPLVPDSEDEENPIDHLLRLSTPRRRPPAPKPEVAEFEHNFDLHPCLPGTRGIVREAGPGARGLSARTPGRSSSAPAVSRAFVECPGCRNGHKKHSITCEHSFAYRQANQIGRAHV